jgi:hypothetical protein
MFGASGSLRTSVDTARSPFSSAAGGLPNAGDDSIASSVLEVGLAPPHVTGVPEHSVGAVGLERGRQTRKGARMPNSATVIAIAITDHRRGDT